MQKFTAANGANLTMAQQQARKSQIILGTFVGGVALLGLGAGVAFAVLDDGAPATSESTGQSTAQQIAALTAPPLPTNNLVRSERRGLRYQPGQTEDIVVQPAAAELAASDAAQVYNVLPTQTAQVDIPAADLEQLVTRSIGAAATAPIGLAPGDFAADVAGLAVSLTTQSAPPPVPQPEPEPIPVAAPAITPQEEPAASIPLDTSQLFTASAAQAANTCVADLRNLAAETRIYFPSGGLNVDEQGIVQARLIGFVARECPGVKIQVQGHSDASGNPAANMRLSEARARTVITRLTAAGVDTSMFEAVGLGDQRPSNVRGPESDAYYDRRVEFAVIETGATTSFGTLPSFSVQSSACVEQLERTVAETRVFFAPRSITASQSDLAPILQLAAAADDCPQARLRIVGQFSDDPGSGETPATARMRALAMMSTLVADGYDPEQIIIAAPSSPTVLANAPGLSERRIDFQIIREEF